MNKVKLGVLRAIGALPALAMALWGFYTGNDFLLKCLFIGLVVTSCVFGIERFFFPLQFRKILLAAYSPPRYLPATPDKVRGLDTPELDRLTNEWQDLGFVPIGDFSIESITPNSPSLFVRLLEHESGTIIQIMQAPSAGLLPFVSHLQSFWGQSERELLLRQAQQGFGATSPPLARPIPLPESEATNSVAPDLKIWSLLTYNTSHKGAKSRYAEFLSPPRFLGQRLDASATPAQLWQAHQQRCSLIEARLGEPSLQGDLLPLLCAHHEALNALISSGLKAASPLSLLKSYYARPAPFSPYFDGELAPLDAKTSS